MSLSPDVMLDVQLSAYATKHKYTSEPQPVIDELRRMAGPHTAVLADMAGTWAGYFDGEHTHPLAAALRGLPGAER